MQETTRLLVLRHGETAWNVDTRIQGHTNIGLNGVGRWQAERLAQALADEPLAALYSSDLARAFDTARAIGQATGLPVAPHQDLRERAFGAFEGRRFVDIEAADPEAAARWRRRDPAFAPPGGESLQRFRDRVVACTVRLAAAHRGAQIAIVAHGGVLDCLYRAATGAALDTPRDWPIANAAVNRLLHHDGGFSLVVWGDSRHLEGAAPRDESGPVA